jgi:hypothetical protein
MATIEKRGQFWRVKVRRTGLPAQTKTFDNRTHAQQWARSVESDLDKGIVVDRRTAHRLGAVVDGEPSPHRSFVGVVR